MDVKARRTTQPSVHVHTAAIGMLGVGRGEAIGVWVHADTPDWVDESVNLRPMRRLASKTLRTHG